MFARLRGAPLAARLAGWLIAGAALCHWLRAVWGRGPTDFDDAYMFLRYAGNLIAGHGLAWNPGEPPVYGATSLPQVIWLAGWRLLFPGLPDGRLLPLAATACAVLALLALVSAGAGYSRHPALRRRWGLWAGVLVPGIALTDPFLFHASTGMDTMLSLLANAGLCLATLRLLNRKTPGAAALAAVAGYVSFAVRPDNLLVAALVPALAVVALGSGRRWPLLRVLVPAWLALVGLDLLARRVGFGQWWPLSFHAKRPGAYTGFAGEHGWNPFLFLRVFLGAALPFLVVLLALARRRLLAIHLVWLGPAALTCAALFLVNPIMGHLGRLFVPMLPFLVVGAGQLIDAWLVCPDAEVGGRRTRSWLLRLGACAAVLLAGDRALLWGAARYEGRAVLPGPAAAGRWRVSAVPPLPQLDSWQAAGHIAELARALPPGTRFAMSEHGLPGARAPQVAIVDVLGLHDRAFSRRFSARDLWRRQPELVWLPHPDHAGMLEDILASAPLWRDYDYYPDAFVFGLAVRRDSPSARAVQQAVERQWQAAYPGVDLRQHRAMIGPGGPVPSGGGSDTLPP